MRKNSLILVLLVFAAGACSTGNQYRVRIEMPVKTQFNLSGYNNIAVANFFIKNPDDHDFGINSELTEYLSDEIGMQLERDVEKTTIELGDEESLADESFWKSLELPSTPNLLISGALEYTQETRKALIGKEKKQFDNPFPEQRKLATRKYYTLNLNLYFVDVTTGKILFQKDYKETQGYNNPNQTANFAFFDLLHRVKEKLFRQVIGGERIQERYLIK